MSGKTDRSIMEFFLPRLKLTYRTAHVEVEDRDDWELVKRTVDFIFKSQPKKESIEKKELDEKIV